MKKILLIIILLLAFPIIVNADTGIVFNKYDITISIDNKNKQLHVREEMETGDVVERGSIQRLIGYDSSNIKSDFEFSNSQRSMLSNVVLKPNTKYYLTYDVNGTNNTSLLFSSYQTFYNNTYNDVLYKEFSVLITEQYEEDIKNIGVSGDPIFEEERTDKNIILKTKKEELNISAELVKVNYNSTNDTDNGPFVYNDIKQNDNNNDLPIPISIIMFIFFVLLLFGLAVILFIYAKLQDKYSKTEFELKLNSLSKTEWYENEKKTIGHNHFVKGSVTLFAYILAITFYSFIVYGDNVDFFNSDGFIYLIYIYPFLFIMVMLTPIIAYDALYEKELQKIKKTIMEKN